MASISIVIAPAGDSSTAANAMRVGFIGLARAAGLDRAQTIAAWKTYQTTPAASDMAGAWDAVMAAISAAPPTNT